MKVLILLPQCDYDPTETAVPWTEMVNAGHDIYFATPAGKAAHADTRLVNGGFSFLSPFFMTRKIDIKKYRAMVASDRFLQPLSYRGVLAAAYDALFIPGGHAAGMKTMIDSVIAQSICRHFFQNDKPVAAVCHGVLLLARSKNRAGLSVLNGRQSTALPASMELSAWAATALWLGRYYRTYPKTVEREVSEAVGKGGCFYKGPILPIRDKENSHRFGFTVRDDNYLSARWPGDCNKFSKDWLNLLNEYAQRKQDGRGVAKSLQKIGWIF
ncbi:MAG: type 1 glutamine amidotransferase domain-containing protein [Bermanella sp.]